MCGKRTLAGESAYDLVGGRLQPAGLAKHRRHICPRAGWAGLTAVAAKADIQRLRLWHRKQPLV